MLAVLAQRTYRHLFLAQVVALVGTGLLTAPTGRFIASSDWWITPFTSALTSILVGAPIWVRQWLLQQQGVP